MKSFVKRAENSLVLERYDPDLKLRLRLLEESDVKATTGFSRQPHSYSGPLPRLTSYPYDYPTHRELGK